MNIIKTNISLTSGEKLHSWYVSPSDAPKAIICLCHGWGEHSHRYEHWAKRFVEEGFAFFTWDHYGHGQSVGKRGHVRDYEMYMDEVSHAISKVNELFPAIPVVLYGHSMGGNIVINFAARKPEVLRLLIVTSPWIELTKPVVAPLIIAVRILDKIWPSLQLTTPLDASLISHVPEVVSLYKTDPLNHSKITPRLFTVINNGGINALSVAEQVKTPTLLLHGDADGVTSYNRSVEFASKSSNCSFVPFSGLFHELHNEAANDKVFNIIKVWLSGNLES